VIQLCFKHSAAEIRYLLSKFNNYLIKSTASAEISFHTSFTKSTSPAYINSNIDISYPSLKGKLPDNNKYAKAPTDHTSHFSL